MKAISVVLCAAAIATLSDAGTARTSRHGRWVYSQQVDDFTDALLSESVLLMPTLFSTAMIGYSYAYEATATTCGLMLGGDPTVGPGKLIYRINKNEPVTGSCVVMSGGVSLDEPEMRAFAHDIATADAIGDVDLVVMVVGFPNTKHSFDADHFSEAMAASGHLKELTK